MRSVQPGAEKINFRIQYSHTHQGTRMSLHHTLSRGIPQLCACRILDKRRRGTCYVKGYRSDVIKTVRKIFGVSRGAVRWCSRLRPVLSSEIHELWRAQIEVSPYAWFLVCTHFSARPRFTHLHSVHLKDSYQSNWFLVTECRITEFESLEESIMRK